MSFHERMGSAAEAAKAIFGEGRTITFLNQEITPIAIDPVEVTDGRTPGGKIKQVGVVVWLTADDYETSGVVKGSVLLLDTGERVRVSRVEKHHTAGVALHCGGENPGVVVN